MKYHRIAPPSTYRECQFWKCDLFTTSLDIKGMAILGQHQSSNKKMKDLQEYWQFAQPKVAHKALNTLVGIVRGIAADDQVNQKEVSELEKWCEDHDFLIATNPFKDVITNIQVIISDNIVTEEEIENLLWVCDQFAEGFTSYDLYTSGLQELQGICHGLLADGVINDTEIHALKYWMDINDHLSTYYPYDELMSVLTEVLEDGVVDDNEKLYLKRFFNEFVELRDKELKEQINIETAHIKVQGICAVDPDIDIDGKQFCITGTSSRSTKPKMAQIVDDLGGIYKGNLSRKTDYLIVCDQGNPCWTFACYGRKIEQAIKLRQAGSSLVIVHENDFWDRVADFD